MDNITFVGLSRQHALQQQVDIIAQNVANVNTQGYKAENLRFREFVVKAGIQKQEKISYQDNIGKLRDLSDGALQTTDNTFDMAIHGVGYFKIQTPQGVQYTRHGAFNVNDAGVLVDNRNQPLLSQENGLINLGGATGQITINRDGSIADETGQIIARVGLVNFDNEIALTRTEANQYTTDQTPRAVVNPQIIQGSLELSNVQPVLEISKLIQAQNDHNLIKGLIDEEAGRQNKILDTFSGKG